MTELEIRQKAVSTIEGWVGAPQGSNTHHQIIDIYNSQKPLPRGVQMSYTMDWCAATVSAVGIALGLTDIMPVECSCGELIKHYKALGRWVEDDAYVPQPGDLILYDWDDNGKGDNVGAPEHVGMVTNVDGNSIRVVEGNMGKPSHVGSRVIQVNARYIRGYGCPDYAAKADKPPEVEKEETVKLYHYVKDMPDWAQEAATKAINNGYIKMDATGSVNMWEVNLQTLVWMDLAGMLDKPAAARGGN